MKTFLPIVFFIFLINGCVSVKTFHEIEDRYANQKINFRDGQINNLQSQLKNIKFLYKNIVIELNDIKNNNDSLILENKKLVPNNKYRLLQDKFKKLNIETNKSFTNFLLINFDKVKKNSSKIFELLAEAGILVRKMNNYNIKNSLRITIGKNDENKKLILKLKEAINV